MATHKICHGKGQLIQNSNHLRDHSDKISGLQAKIHNLLGGSQAAETLLSMIKLDKPRYIRDQFLLIKAVVANHNAESIKLAIDYCVENELWSAVDFRATTEYFSQTKIEAKPATNICPAAMPPKFNIKPVKRDINDYVAVCGGGS